MGRLESVCDCAVRDARLLCLDRQEKPSLIVAPAPHPLLSAPQGYKAQLTQMGQWEAAMASLQPAVQQKLSAMCQV